MKLYQVILIIGIGIGFLAAGLLIFMLLSSVEIAVYRTVSRTLTRGELLVVLVVVLALTAMAIYALKRTL
ncbi:MAG TPA: hypothetical protein VNA17_04050 [Pyrinomonadaceae bacterium]|nr:hypothetical protein [Pyrinomonadaceae bacterium]